MIEYQKTNFIYEISLAVIVYNYVAIYALEMWNAINKIAVM